MQELISMPMKGLSQYSACHYISGLTLVDVLMHKLKL